MTTKIFLVRHAEAEGNLFRVAHGQYDSNITPQGYRQLAYLRRRFQGERLDAFAKVRGVKACKQRAVDATRDSVEEFQRKGWNFVVGTAHTYRTQEEIQAWQKTLEDNFPGIPAFHGELALSIGCHTGPGAFGMGLVRRVNLPKK